jgi:murein hydrolase activator
MMRISRVITLCIALLFLLGGGPAANGGIPSGKQKLERIKREMREKKRAIKRAVRKERSIISEMDAIQRQIQAGSAELTDRRKRLLETETALREIERQSAGIDRNLSRLKRAYALRLRALYKMSRSGFAAALLTAGGPGGAVKLVKYLGIIAERDRALVGEYRGALEQLAVRQAEIAEKKKSLLAGKRQIEIKKSDLEAQKRKKKNILTKVRKEKGLYEQTLSELAASSAALWSMIKHDEGTREASRARSPAASQRGVVVNADRNRLPWPLEGHVLSRFGLQRHPRFGTMVFRRGIEIEAREGEPVRAVADGTVAYANWYKGYGMLIILDHGNGFYSLYGNLSQVDFAKGDGVARGQVVGLTGDTGSFKGSSLYFEIRRNGAAQDPLVWLVKR